MKTYYLFAGPSDKTLGHAMQYVSKCAPSVSGSGGHNTTFSVACRLVEKFNLTESGLLEVLREYNHQCAPPWSEKELRHKAQDAIKAIRK